MMIGDDALLVQARGSAWKGAGRCGSAYPGPLHGSCYLEHRLPCRESFRAGSDSVFKRAVLPICVSDHSISQTEWLHIRNITHTASPSDERQGIVVGAIARV